jgi:hypothetical protein
MKQNYRAQAKELFSGSLARIEGVLLKSGAAMLEQMHVELAQRDAEIDRLNKTLGTLIAWLPQELGQQAQKDLLSMLPPPKNANES